MRTFATRAGVWPMPPTMIHGSLSVGGWQDLCVMPRQGAYGEHAFGCMATLSRMDACCVDGTFWLCTST
jgi:hypothetical protein